MDLTLTVEEQEFQTQARKWLAANAPKPFTGDARFNDLGYVEYLRAWQRRLFDGGWCGLSWPKEYGGRGATPVEAAIMEEEMARAKVPDIIGKVGVSLIGPTIITVGTVQQKKRYLQPMLTGEEIWCQGFSEPNSGSDLASLSCRAVRDGEEFIINGQKTWTSYGHVAAHIFLLARSATDVPKHQGITCLLVDMKTPGITVRPVQMMSGDWGFNEVFFSDVRVPADRVLGEVNGGWEVAITALMNERANLGGAVRIAGAEFLQSLIDKAPGLPGYGDDGTILANDQLIRQKLAQAHIELEVFRMTSTRALARVSKGGVPGPEGSILKLYWSEMNQRMAQMAMDIVGARGQLTAGDGIYKKISYFYLRSRGNTIEAGTSEIMRNIVAQRVLGLPRS